MNKVVSNLLCFGRDKRLADMLSRNIPQDRFSISQAVTEGELHSAVTGSRIHAILLSEEGGNAEIIYRIRENIVSSFIPVFYVAYGAPQEKLPEELEELFDGFITIDTDGSDNVQTAKILNLIEKRINQVFHPVSKLPTGTALASMVTTALTRNKKNVFLLMIKLHGLKAYNLFKTYDDGDRMISAVSSAISEIAAAQAGEGSFAGHYASDEFLLFSYEKRMEGVCKTILQKTERVFRSLYSPFELMRGYITLEGEKNTHYYLAEVMVAGIEVPSQWDSHYVYIVDLLKDLLKKIESDDMGFRIVKL